jgi:hypothetical protein
MPAYQLAVVVDDSDMWVTEVIRGDDLIPSTPATAAVPGPLGGPAGVRARPVVVGPDGRGWPSARDTRLSKHRKAACRRGARRAVGVVVRLAADPTPTTPAECCRGSARACRRGRSY